MPADNTQVISNEHELPEFIDQSVWVPKGEEVVPAMMFLNQHAVVEGKRFVSTAACHVDKLFAIGRIDQEHHAVAQRLIQLYRMGTTRQDYAVMKISFVPHGMDNSDFCPISLFIRVTRQLSPKQKQLVRYICGLDECDFMRLSVNASQIKDVLENVGTAFTDYEEAEAAKLQLKPSV